MTDPGFAEELAAAGQNFNVGTKLWFENEHVRIWEIRLAAGERTPFHAHARPYFWTCISPGRATQRFADGRQEHMTYADGQTKFSYCTESDPLIHDLENEGDTLLRFVTVELVSQLEMGIEAASVSMLAAGRSRASQVHG